MVYLRSSAADTCLLRPRRAARRPEPRSGRHPADRRPDRALRARTGWATARAVRPHHGRVRWRGPVRLPAPRHGGAARAVGVVRFVAHAEEARAAGAQEVVVGEDNAGAARFGLYDVILDSVGGASLASALPLVAEGGTCIAFGTTGGGESTIRVWDLCGRGGATLYGFLINYVVKHSPSRGGAAPRADGRRRDAVHEYRSPGVVDGDCPGGAKLVGAALHRQGRAPRR